MNKEILELYSDYLIASFNYTTATGLSAALNERISHDKITRFLSEKDLDSKELWLLTKPIIRQYEQDDGVIIFDDTIEEKPYTQESVLICWHYDPRLSHKKLACLSAKINASGESENSSILA